MRAYNKHKLTPTFFVGALTIFTLLSALLLSSPHTSADSSAGVNVSVTVPAMCSLTANPDTLSTTITPGNSGLIGTSTIKAICNDPSGLAVYAVGYTNDAYGNNNLATTVGGNTINIPTGIVASPTTSQWNMTINAVSGTYAPTIVPEFNNTAHTIPDQYTKVAYRNTMTDMGENATGANFTAAFNAYIGPTQAAGTYTGKVKFTLVHPVAAEEPIDDDQIAVIYDGNGLTFEGEATTNRVVYAESCADEMGYIADTPTIIKTPNLNNDGTQIAGEPYDDDGYYEGGLGDGYYRFEGASKIKMIMDYRVTNSTYLSISASSDWENMNCYSEEANGCSGTRTMVFDSEYIDLYLEIYDSVDPDYDYGIYIQVYPIYDEEHEGATYGVIRNVCTFVPVSGVYDETTTWNGGWYMVETDGGNSWNFDNESGVIWYLENNKETLSGTTIIVFARNTYTVIFDANGGSGTMTSQELYPYYQNFLNKSTFTMTHSDVVRWSTEPDGSGESYPASGGTLTQIYKPIANTPGGGSVTLYAQWGACAPRSVCYDDNGANSETAMDRQNGGFNSTSVSSLWASNFQRSGYGFAGWNTKADGSGTKYGPNENLGILGSSLVLEGLRMYAMWIPSAGNIQNWTGCSALSIGDVTALTDTRDGNTYAVAKLADGNCWMIENLRLGGATGMTLTASDTQTAGTLPASTDTFGTAENGQYINAKNTLTSASKMTSEEGIVYSYGNYYSWAAAINSTTIYDTGTANTSICPSGWQLPYGGSSGDGNISGGFYYLGRQLGAIYNNNFETSSSEKWRRYPNNFLAHGGYYSGTDTYGYEYSNYWSSSSYKYGNTSRVGDLTIGHSYLDTMSGGVARYTGKSVRCLVNQASSSSSNTSSNASNSSSPSNTNSSPLSMQSYSGQGMNYAGQNGTNSTNNEEDDNKETGNNSNSGNTAPLGVKKSSDEVASVVTSNSSSDIYGAVAIAGAATLVGAGIFFAAKKKKDDEGEAQ